MNYLHNSNCVLDQLFTYSHSLLSIEIKHTAIIIGYVMLINKAQPVQSFRAHHCLVRTRLSKLH